ncbi:hypothetical protein ACQEVB_31525 [Pseudonocardia sp. CA-107938]|uniref:hypothetical protein n=1 Tax=Pseudonocardia sp. CA-107938 TaxID=3240021 RepID=UPI003D943103
MSAADLLARFTGPEPRFGPLPIWWWSGARVTRERLREQMQQLIAGGVRQAVVLCLAPTGPTFGAVADDPPFLSDEWIALFDGACADAAELGFTLWLYDQIGFSGANFQGRLIAREPSFEGWALRRTEEHVPDALAAYAVPDDGAPVAVPIVDGQARWPAGPARRVLVHAVPAGFDYFNPSAGQALLAEVHGRLEAGLGQWFGTSIDGFFQDELPPMPTWGPDFADTFRATYGYGVLDEPWALFEEGPAGARVRRDYQEHRATLARRGFMDAHDAWFRDRGLICGFDQASPSREGSPHGGVATYGDYLGLHTGYGAPGSDHWGDAKVHSSLAHANGHERVWIEAFHSSGWGGTLEETYDWLAPFLRRGANLYDPHAVYYSTVGGWWEWAPPSTCWRQPYWPAYPVFAGAIARLCSVLTAGTHVVDVAVVSPTTQVQAHTGPEGTMPAARRAGEAFLALNGVGTWFAERRGALERAGIDHDALDEATLARGEIEGSTLRVGAAAFHTVVVPGVDALRADCAARLLDLAAAGGRLICVGKVPTEFPAGDSTGLAERFAAAAVVVPTAEDVPAAILAGPVGVRADAPFLLRRHGDTHVLALTAHDDETGTAAPMMGAADVGDGYWLDDGWFSFERYNEVLRDTGYTFRPPRDRVAHVHVEGIAAPRAQSWAPGRGTRTELAVRADGNGWAFDVPFDDGAIALVVLGADLPDATAEPLGPVAAETVLDGPWTARAESTLDNSRGDLAAANRPGILPIEVWRFEHRTDAGWAPVTASFGPFAEIIRDGVAEQAEWSLSRGIRDDPLHTETLGPKGQVPEEFVDVRPVRAGETILLRTHLTLPAREGLTLAVGASAPRRVLLDGVEQPAEGTGHQTFTPLAVSGTVLLEIEFRPLRDGVLRAGFAVITDVAAFRRPEQLRGRELSRTFSVTGEPVVVHVASDGACAVLLNGVEIGRQGDFSPYPDQRFTVGQAYELAPPAGENVLTLRLGDGATATVDCDLPELVSGPGWGAELEPAFRHDPRFHCARARPHPLPTAGWLDPAADPGDVVVPLVPDLAPGGPRTEFLRFTAPPGTTALTVPTDLDVVATVGGEEVKVVDGVLRLPSPAAAGTEVVLEVQAVDGRRGGALLSGPVQVEVAEAEVPLASWAELGLRNLGGSVTYRTSLHVDGVDGRFVLDLGDVRGTADVVVNGTLAETRVWGPWRAEVTELLRPGANTVEVVVRGTLAGYLDDASPTQGVYAGQVRTGLFGPVVLRRH